MIQGCIGHFANDMSQESAELTACRHAGFVMFSTADHEVCYKTGSGGMQGDAPMPVQFADGMTVASGFFVPNVEFRHNMNAPVLVGPEDCRELYTVPVYIAQYAGDFSRATIIDDPEQMVEISENCDGTFNFSLQVIDGVQNP